MCISILLFLFLLLVANMIAVIITAAIVKGGRRQSELGRESPQSIQRGARTVCSRGGDECGRLRPIKMCRRVDRMRCEMTK
jgi:hypothetical protein